MRFFLSSNRTFFCERDPQIAKLRKLGFLFKEIHHEDMPTEFKLISTVASANYDTMEQAFEALDKLELIYTCDNDKLIEIA